MLTGRENLVLTGRLLGLGRAGARRRADELLERFDLTEPADRRVAAWSGGMRRRLDLAASLVTTPRVLVLDEPTTGLDARSRGALWEEVRGIAAAGTTVLLTTQYLEEADVLADRPGRRPTSRGCWARVAPAARVTVSGVRAWTRCSSTSPATARRGRRTQPVPAARSRRCRHERRHRAGTVFIGRNLRHSARDVESLVMSVTCRSC